MSSSIWARHPEATRKAVAPFAFAQKQARANVDSMLPYVRRGYKIAAINPTCSMTMRREYPLMLAGEDVKEFAASVVDPNGAAAGTGLRFHNEKN